MHINFGKKMCFNYFYFTKKEKQTFVMPKGAKSL